MFEKAILYQRTSIPATFHKHRMALTSRAGAGTLRNSKTCIHKLCPTYFSSRERLKRWEGELLKPLLLLLFRLAESKLNFQDNFLLYTEFRENKRLLVFFWLRRVTQRRLRLGLEKKHREEKEISGNNFLLRQWDLFVVWVMIPQSNIIYPLLSYPSKQ